ncbi:Transglycosylase SLT domain-containing protein [Marinitoga hydrogenitolerans DSM 16785]|uniref:Transglycosylase SLT domain-containing protein n=1 Tax=Marinitoga hydrogenitolerans (strain DSM 16785 / JCM 12826 / AT1271) TaxID=1122195 RepID=A0A1M5A146_MARH1|nr:transglycosylase SLT domain-containing protein [Marinitoga hydrogenitolerans]SHF23626.1 Transglycosylase SLT domain-containing protein [Marinitoga hydrogenitolerans DSM 16785]
MKKIYLFIYVLMVILIFSEEDPFKMPEINMDIDLNNNLFSDEFNKYVNEINEEWNEHLNYMDEQWKKLYEESQKEWDKYYEEYNKQEKEFMNNFEKIWGETFEYDSHKWYDFSDDLKSFSVVTFDRNEENKNGYMEVKIIVDKKVPKEKVKEKIKEQIKRTVNKKDVYTKKPILDNLIKVKDIENPKIQKEKEIKDKIIYKTKIPIIKNPFLERAKQYIPLINNVKSKYGIPRPFILSIIQKESSFLPNSRSRSGALGLMQLIPRYGATEAYIYLFKRKPNPRALINELYNPEKNILYGTTYIYLLHTKYFKFEKEYSKRKYMVIAGYNMGPVAISKRVRGLNLEKMNLSGLYNYLLSNTRKETSDYLKKVLQYEREWNKIYP